MSKVYNNDMEKSNRSYGKKSDKETHTPMLKIFKDMIQLEKNDPEKANLLKDKERNKKRKQYAVARSKSDIINRSCDSSSSDRHRVSPADHREYDVQCHGISKLSSTMLKKPDIFHMQHKKDGKRSESTDSGISCALKRLATSEYTCIACLGVIFVITVIVAFCMVFRTTNPCAAKVGEKRVSRTIFRGRDFGEAGLKEGLEDRSDWDDSKLGRYGDLSLSDFDESSKGLKGVSKNQFSELSRIIDIKKLNYGKSSERLKSFYKKLLQTDDQIKNLKKGMTDFSYSNMKTPDRKKRSVKHHHFHCKNYDSKRFNEKNRRNKRYLNYTGPTGFVIEKKKITVHLPTEKKVVPKCSHAPKDSKSHETELKHPFYKHTQRLDELLDQFLDKNLPQIFGDLNFESIFETNKLELTTRKIVTPHKKGHMNINVLTDNFRKGTPNDLFTITKNDKLMADVMLGVTTVMTPPKKIPTKSHLDRVPNIRKLMQAYEDDDENLGYEDFKEVLTDDVESHDDTEVKVDRNKRSYENDPNPLILTKNNPPEVQIPNWKGPLPLYPDELNTMIKDRKENSNKPMSKNINRGNIMFTDIEYVEDYLTDKYEKLANMAQAYSDYGVLDEKKETKDDNPKSDNTDRSKLSFDIPKLHKKLLDRFKKGTTESLNLYNTHTKECFSVPKFLKKHFQIKNGLKSGITDPNSGEVESNQLKFKFENNDAQKQDNKFKQDITSVPEKHFYEQNQKHLRIDRSVENKVNSDEEKNKRSLKNIDKSSVTVKAGDYFELGLGMGQNMFANENESIRIDFGLGSNKNTQIYVGKTTHRGDTDTPKISNENTYKHRSLKSIEESDQEKVIGIDDDITMDELTTEFVEDLNTSNVITIPARNHKEAVIGVDDNFEFEGLKQGIKTDMNKFDTITSKHYEADIIDNVTALNIMKNLSRKESTAKLNDKSRANLDKDTQKKILSIVDLVNSQNNTRKLNDGMDLSDFLRMISTWFSSLASASLDDNADNSSTVNPIMNLKTTISPGDVKVKDLNRSDIHYPSYDSDMFDNIGHRSRVLMSVDEATNATDEKKEMDVDLNSEKDHQRTADVQNTNTTETPENHVLTKAIEERDSSGEEKNLADNKTVVKRSIGDSGLVFWSDLYDDEYGIKVDPLEKELAGKNRGKEFMKRSKNWFQDKVKSIADNIKGHRNEGDRSNGYDETNRNAKFNHIYKRQAELDKSYNAEGQGTNFAELTARMRNVVKEAAKAVQQTRKMEVRENKEDSVANGIMQQLVRMMSDLVNFQVQQQTCVKLPVDLQNFLEWITSPNQDRQSPRHVNLQDNRLDDSETFGKDKDVDTPLMIQDKTECLETLHAVEDLIQQYDQMDDEDKSKMSGVRQYLENQMEFLNKQISVMDEFNFSNIYGTQSPSRFRRHLTTQKTPQLNRNNIKRRIKRRLRKFMSNFRKQHNKQTLSPTINVVAKRVHDKNTNSDKESHGNDNKEVIVKKNDGNERVDEEIGDKIHKSKTNEGQDSIKSFTDEYSVFNDKNGNYKKFDKNLPRNDDSNNIYRNSDEFEQNDDFYSQVNGQQDSQNKNDDNIVKRNLQDVYYRALYEAKKVTTVKNIDKTDSSL